MARDGVLLDNFAGGLNNVTDPSIIAENELAEATNVILTRNGKLASRYPFLVEKAKNALPSGATKLTPLGYFRNEDGLTQMVVASQAKTYLYNFSTKAWTEIATFAAADITTYYNRLYLVNPGGYGGYYHKNQSTGVYEFITLNDSTTGMPAGNQIHYTKGRIYISSRAGRTSTLRYSNITVIDGESIDEFPTSNFIDINEGDGELLLKIVEGNSELFIFRSHSTWRLAFGASAEPTDGVLTQLSSTVGVDNEFGVVAGENYHAVMYGGTLYRLAGYNYYPFNDANKVEFKTSGSGYTINTAVSKVGQYLLAWYYGSIYCFDTEANAWTQWTSTLDAAYFIEAPRGTLAAANEPLVGFGIGADTDEQSLLKFALKYDGGDANEIITCRIKTKTYDAGLPTKFKRMFGWDLLVVAVKLPAPDYYPLKASIVALEEQTPPTSWTTLQTFTWAAAEAAGKKWAPAGIAETLIEDLPAENPIPSIVKVAGKTTFKRAYFTVEFTNKGTGATAPSRLDGIVLYMTSGRKSSVERVS